MFSEIYSISISSRCLPLLLAIFLDFELSSINLEASTENFTEYLPLCIYNSNLLLTVSETIREII